MGFFSNLKKSLSGDDEAEAKPLQPEVEVKSKGPTIKPMERNEKTDFQLLLSLYKKHKTDENADFITLVRTVSPDATPHKCPYCSVVHTFTASRARKCPACSKKMIVRQGLFVTEEQAKQIEGQVQQFYDRQNYVMRVGNLLESIQNAKLQERRVEHMESMAEAFRFMAQIENHRDGGGYSFWDKAWGYYGAARLEAMKEIKDEFSMQYSHLPDLSWNMMQMILDQTKGETKPERIIKGKRRALAQAFFTLAEAAKFGADPYFRTSLYALAKRTIDELQLPPEESKKMSAEMVASLRLDSKAQEKYAVWLGELLDYEVINNTFLA